MVLYDDTNSTILRKEPVQIVCLFGTSHIISHFQKKTINKQTVITLSKLSENQRYWTNEALFNASYVFLWIDYSGLWAYPFH